MAMRSLLMFTALCILILLTGVGAAALLAPLDSPPPSSAAPDALLRPTHGPRCVPCREIQLGLLPR
jgi:hypothetical protein